jgi:hypothetical protein
MDLFKGKKQVGVVCLGKALVGWRTVDTAILKI